MFRAFTRRRARAFTTLRTTVRHHLGEQHACVPSSSNNASGRYLFKGQRRCDGVTSTSYSTSSSSGGRAGANKGPVGWVSLALVSATGGVCLYLYDQERARRVEAVRSAKVGGNGFQTRVAGGKAAVGGPFTLVDASTGKKFTDENLRGKFALLYFGFTYCPDICPDELEKVAKVTDAVRAARGGKDADAADALVPVFITIDPARDDAKRTREYVKEFHPKMIGLTGTDKTCGEAARKYRVYYRKTGDERAKKDYLVDHSIITYLINPDGDFVTFYGKNTTEEEVTTSILAHMREYYDAVTNANRAAEKASA